jgi:hypothetical protein
MSQRHQKNYLIVRFQIVTGYVRPPLCSRMSPIRQNFLR